MLTPYCFTLSSGRKISGQQLLRESNYSVTLCLHGWLDNSASFLNLIDNLPKEFGTVIAIDLPGHGQSDHIDKSSYYLVSSFAVDVAEIVSSLEADHTVNIVGHSLGAGIGLVLCSLLTTRISKFIMIDGLGPFALNQSPDESAQLLRQNLEKRLKGGSEIRRYDTVEAAAERRARQNIGGLMELRDAVVLAERGTMFDATTKTFTWSTDSRLLWPSLIRYTEASILAQCSDVTANVLIILTSNGLYKQLLNLGVSRSFRLKAHAFSVFVGLWLYVGSFFASIFSPSLGAYMVMGCNLGRRVRRLKKKKIVVLQKGGHHVHLSKEGAERVASVIGNWEHESGHKKTD